MKKEQNLFNDLDASIRDYRSADFKEVTSLWESLSLTNPDRCDYAEVIEETLRLGGKLLLLINPIRDQIIGTAWLSYDGRRINLHHFGIHPDFQHKGLGYKLGLECLKFAGMMKTQIRLEVHDGNTAATRLYKKLGFTSFPGYTIYMVRDV